MGEQNLNIRIKHKYDTEANWNKNNPVLLSGEIATNTTGSVPKKTNRYKNETNRLYRCRSLWLLRF